MGKSTEISHRILLSNRLICCHEEQSLCFYQCDSKPRSRVHHNMLYVVSYCVKGCTTYARIVRGTHGAGHEWVQSNIPNMLKYPWFSRYLNYLVLNMSLTRLKTSDLKKGVGRNRTRTGTNQPSTDDRTSQLSNSQQPTTTGYAKPTATLFMLLLQQTIKYHPQLAKR